MRGVSLSENVPQQLPTVVVCLITACCQIKSYAKFLYSDTGWTISRGSEMKVSRFNTAEILQTNLPCYASVLEGIQLEKINL